MNNPKCVSSCGSNYIDSLTDSDKPRCILSCKNLIPTAYIKKSDTKECTRGCETDYYIDSITNPDHPVCRDKFPGKYIDKLTDSNAGRWVESCQNLIPSAYRDITVADKW